MERCCLRYQSPISVDDSDAVSVYMNIQLYMCENSSGILYNVGERKYQCYGNVIITDSKKYYRLEEYHFHMPGEHTINGIKYPAELHYVFREIESNSPIENTCDGNICDCSCALTGGNVLVIGWGIIDTTNTTDTTNTNDTTDTTDMNFKISNIDLYIPEEYYIYDGALTAGDISTPVRWILGKYPLQIPLIQINSSAKTSRPTQPPDNRLILKNIIPSYSQ